MSKKILGLFFVGFTVLIGSCIENKTNEEPEIEKSSVEKTIDFIGDFIENPSKYSDNINIDHILITNETRIIDSTRRKSYLEINPQDSKLIFKTLKEYFDEKLGVSKGSTTFCSWKKRKSKYSFIEILLINESENKNRPYLVLEIEEVNE